MNISELPTMPALAYRKYMSSQPQSIEALEARLRYAAELLSVIDPSDSEVSRAIGGYAEDRIVEFLAKLKSEGLC